MTRFPSPSSFLAAAALLVTALGLSGCQMGEMQLSGPAPSQVTAGTQLAGLVHGGQYPIAFSQIQLYAAAAPTAPATGAATGGLGQGATALITPGSGLGFSDNYTPGSATANCNWTTGNPNTCTLLPSTNSVGRFSISGTYTCTSAQELYIVATGGDSDGNGTFSVNNSDIALMAALGPCSGIGSSTQILLNEVTTVGAVYSLNQFMAAPATSAGGIPASSYVSQGGATAGIGVNIGASSGPVGGYGPSALQTQQIGMTNAFNMVNNITDYTQGTANPIAANTWANPYTQMTNTIADILAACINTTASNSTSCTNLMTYAKVTGISYIPADTIQATWMMARYPQGVAVANLYGLVTATGAGDPFPNNLSTAPSQLTIEVGYQPAVSGTDPVPTTGCSTSFGTSATNCAISNPITGAFDAYGNLWTYNFNPQSPAGTTTAPQTKSFVTQIASNGALLNGPFNSYSAHGGYQVTGADPCSSGYTHYLSFGTSNVPEGIAIDQNNVVFVSNSAEYTATQGALTCATTSLATSAFSLMRITGSNTAGGASIATGYYTHYAVGPLAVDGGDNIWAAESNTNLSSAGFPIVTLTNAGTFATGSFNTFGDYQIAIDTAGGSSGGTTTGNVWTGSTSWCTSGTVGTYFGVLYESPTSSLSAPTLTGGFYGNGVTCNASQLDSPTQQVNNGAGLGAPYGVAVDKNNGVWTANYKAPTGISTGTATYLLPTASTWVNTGGTQAAPNTATQIPVSAATDAQTSGSNTNGYGLSGATWVAVDGSNIAWIANQGGGSNEPLFQVAVGTGPTITSVTSPAIVGGGASGLKVPTSANVNPFINNAGTNWVGIDPSGNVWYLSAKSQSSGATTQQNYVTVVVGAATPVITPLAYQVQYNRIGQTPQ